MVKESLKEVEEEINRILNKYKKVDFAFEDVDFDKLNIHDVKNVVQDIGWTVKELIENQQKIIKLLREKEEG